MTIERVYMAKSPRLYRLWRERQTLCGLLTFRGHLTGSERKRMRKLDRVATRDHVFVLVEQWRSEPEAQYPTRVEVEP